MIRKLTGGLAGLAKQRKVTVVTGVASFVDPHHVEVRGGDGKKQVIKFDHCIIAAGSQAVKLPFIPDDPRVVDSTGALELGGVPAHMLVIGGGIIGMEMAQVYSALGAKITVVEMLSQLMTGADPDLVRPFAKRMEKRYEKIMLKTRVTKVEAQKDGLKVWFEGEQAPATPQVVRPRCWSRSGARPTARRSTPSVPGSSSTTAASFRSTISCGPTSRTFSPSATSPGSRCWRTRRCTRRMSRPK